jgi:hypothetical protein
VREGLDRLQSEPSADFLKSKLGNNERLERFDGDGHALFVDDPEKFNHVKEKKSQRQQRGRFCLAVPFSGLASLLSGIIPPWAVTGGHNINKDKSGTG